MAKAKRGQLIRRAVSGRQQGVSLVEVLIAVSLFGFVVTGLVTALVTGLRAGSNIEDNIASANLVATQLEDILAQTYVEPAVYSTLTVPEGFSVSVESAIVDPTLKESIRVIVSSSAEILLYDITTHKYNSSFVATPAGAVLAQRDFRWYDNNGISTPTSS